MTAAERAILVGLDQILQSERVQTLIRPVVERVRAKLSREATSLMAWEPIPLTVYGGVLPGAVKSSWVFVLRAGANTGAERHPNSHQRMMSCQGAGDMQVQAGSSKSRGQSTAAYARGSGEPKEVGDQWKSNVLIS